MPLTNSARFLNAFAGLEKHLRAIVKADRNVSFSSLVESAAGHSPSIRRYRDDLKEYADLRNAIVHERTDGRPIAEPHPRVVSEMERLLNLVTNPPSVLPLFQKNVQTVDTRTPIHDALRFFSPKNFSQVPVTSGGRLVGLLTTNTVSRWLASQVANELVDLHEHLVSDALKHTEYDGNWRVVPRATALSEILENFDAAKQSGRRLDAVLISHAGKPSETLLGIITIHDIPKLLRALKS